MSEREREYQKERDCQKFSVSEYENVRPSHIQRQMMSDIQRRSHIEGESMSERAN